MTSTGCVIASDALFLDSGDGFGILLHLPCSPHCTLHDFGQLNFSV